MRRPSSPSSRTTSRTAATAGRGSPTLMPRAGGRPRRSTAARERLGVGRPQRDRRAGDLGALRRQLHPRRPRSPRRLAAVRQEARRRRALLCAWPARSGRPPLRARIAMQRNAADAESRYQAVIGQVTSDAGLMMDRARYLRANNYDQSAQRARRPRRTSSPIAAADPERFFDMLLPLANDAAQDRQLADGLQHHPPDRRRAAGRRRCRRATDRICATITRASPGSAECIALDRINRPASAVAMFDRYARARPLAPGPDQGQLLGRAARRLAAGRFQEANAYFQRAAAYPELFYGQLALERLGRSVTPPPQALPQYTTTAAQRTAFNAKPPRPGGAACSASRAARPSRRCSSRRSPNRSTTTSTATLRSSLASRSAGRTCRSGSRAWRGSRARCSTSARPTRRCRPRSRANCGRSPTASAGRKARSIPMRSAMPARAA